VLLAYKIDKARVFLGEFRAALGNEGRAAGSRDLLRGEFIKLSSKAAAAGGGKRSFAFALIADSLIQVRIGTYKLASLAAVESCLRLAVAPKFGLRKLNQIRETLASAGFKTEPQSEKEEVSAAE
jgi:hypothetical protein